MTSLEDTAWTKCPVCHELVDLNSCFQCEKCERLVCEQCFIDETDRCLFCKLDEYFKEEKE